MVVWVMVVGNSGDGEKRLIFGYILTVEFIGFVEWLGRCERGVKVGIKIFGLSNCENEIVVYLRWGKIVGGVGLGGGRRRRERE